MADSIGGADEQWLRRPDVYGGLALGAALAVRSFGPSLMPRTTANQALVSGVSGAMGFGLGDASYGLLARTGSELGDLSLAAAVSVGGLSLSRVVGDRADDEGWPAVGRAVGDIAAACGLTTAAIVAVRGSRRRFTMGAGVAALASAAGARAVYRGLRAQRAALEDGDPPLPRPLPALTQSVAVGAALAALVNGYRSSGQALAHLVERRLGLTPTSSHWVGDGLAIALWAGTARALSGSFVGGLRVYDRVVDVGFDRPPSTPCRSSGDGSPIPFARLGREGRRFVTNVAEADDIETVMGRPAIAEPVRVFVGYSAAGTDEERVALAMDELRRTGAFDRALLVVGSPAGNGLINTLVLETLDHLLLGDVAGVGVQYGRLPSFLTLNRVTRGGHVHRALLAAIAVELAGRPADRRPRVVVYGESLGAWTGQDAFLHEGVAGLDAAGVDRALWAGTPYYSGWRRQVLVERTVAVPEGSVVEVGSAAELLALGADELAALRVVIIGHDNDPVRYVSAGLLVRRPRWLNGHERPRRVPDEMRWWPGVTVAQVLMDAVNATRPTPGVFRATGHVYSADLPDAVRVAYDIEHPGHDVWSRLIEHLQAADAARAPKHARHAPAGG